MNRIVRTLSLEHLPTDVPRIAGRATNVFELTADLKV